VIRSPEAELLAEHDLPLAPYDVLVWQSEASGRRLRIPGRMLLLRS
jgi:hypothetical protein